MFIRLLVVLALAGAIAACGGGGAEETPSPTASPVPTTISDPARAVKNAVSTMRGLQSYTMEISFSPFGAPIGSYVTVDGTDFYERIPSDLSKRGGSQYVFKGDYTYKRDCTSADACGQWTRSSGRPLIPSLAGTVSSIPETLGVVAIELATGWTVESGIGEVKVSATVDLHHAVEENQRRAFRAAGNSPQDVEDGLKKLADSGPPAGPSAISVTLSPDNHFITHIAIATPGQASNPYMDVDFSNFNEVIVSAPTNFAEATTPSG